MQFPKKLQQKLTDRKASNSFRSMANYGEGIDLYSNDYLGLAKNQELHQKVQEILKEDATFTNGAGGSRLLSGTHKAHEVTEDYLATFHHSEAALLFPSGYTANLGLFSCLLQKEDCILYDQYIHASIRDAFAMTTCRKIKFAHNDTKALEQKLQLATEKTSGVCYVVVESVYSMDGDSPDLCAMVALCKQYQAYIIVDEAHAAGVIGKKGEGLTQYLGLEKEVFARIHTFGKAIGGHGAMVLSCANLKAYLVNFSRPFIYTTALDPSATILVREVYKALAQGKYLKPLQDTITYFKACIQSNGLQEHFIASDSAIHCVLVPGIERVKKAAAYLNKKGYAIKPVLSPTVAKGEERLRICIHAYNKSSEIDAFVVDLRKALL